MKFIYYDIKLNECLHTVSNITCGKKDTMLAEDQGACDRIGDECSVYRYLKVALTIRDWLIKIVLGPVSGSKFNKLS